MQQQEFFADSAASEAAFMLPPDVTAIPFPSATAPEAPAAAQEQEQAPEPEPVEEDVPEFDPKQKEPFSGLLYVGALTHKFSLYGHSFVIATPTQTERLQMGIVIQPYQNTLSAEIAYSTALVAAYLVSIDGVMLPEPIMTNPKETSLLDRFTWVTENIRRPVIDKIFDECLKLDGTVMGVLDAMGKASG
jgi:hypothetical protein